MKEWRIKPIVSFIHLYLLKALWLQSWAMNHIPVQTQPTTIQVEDKTNSVIYPLVITKAMMTTFMANDPYSSANTPLSDPISRPRKL
ncbi:hypothetical protein RDI58_027922 [Solanum bulbocastanum]|uniref:Uncharacterized protein n=1 Tax=Solanum bulbocastanum TaxID=147425 RepID=A0AAN8SPY6_SOLBU